jgi:hypothetical protein
MQAYSVLQSKYGWNTDFIKGKWKKICPYSSEPCIWGSCLDRKTCKNWNLELYGLTRALFLRFVEIASDDNYQREKRLYNVLGMLIVGQPVIKESNYSNRVVDVAEKKKDILYDFPYDIEYPSERVIQDNLKYWSEVKEESIERWDDERADAARNKMGVIARRCSVNSLLWMEFKNGAFKDQVSLKNRLKLDHIRLAFYPLNFSRSKICIEPPPLDYWQGLKEKGDLQFFINELDKAGFVDLENVVPLTEELKELIKDFKVVKTE